MNILASITEMKILITGSNGLLGQKIVAHCLKQSINFVATSKGQNRNPECPSDKFQSLDIIVAEEIRMVLDRTNPTHVIHTAALTNVDYCELHPDECQLTNVVAVRYLFDECTKRGIHFQLLSTDFVFNGDRGNYREEDQTTPLSVYARSKVDAEDIVRSTSTDNWSIVRTIIVYGKGHALSRNNIVSWAKEALFAGQEMKIVDDQFRAPTWADDLAWACIRICQLNEKGIFHVSGPETMSVYEIVERIADYYNLPKDHLLRVSSATLNQPATRPPKTGFDISKSRRVLGYAPKTLEETLDLI